MIDAHIAAAGGNARILRDRFVGSPEFLKYATALKLFARDADRLTTDVPPYAPPRAGPVVFIHVPKAAGSTVHHHLSAFFDPAEICGYRHNDILAAPCGALAGKRLYSGHFDARILHLHPGATVLTVLRDPARRLHSVYRYLRATRPDRRQVLNQHLAEIARVDGFEAFLHKAAAINPGAVDNVYTRTFGGALPTARWEGRAEDAWLDAHGTPSDAQWAAMVARARAVLSRPGLTILSFDRLAADLAAVVARLWPGADVTVRHLKDHSGIDERTIGFEPVETEPFAPNATLDRLTRFDRGLARGAEKGRIAQGGADGAPGADAAPGADGARVAKGAG